MLSSQLLASEIAAARELWASVQADPAAKAKLVQLANADANQRPWHDYEAHCRRVLAERELAPAAHHKLIIDAVEEVIAGKPGAPRRLLITAPPGSAKSTYTSELLPTHLFNRYPRFNLIGASNTATLAEDFSDRSLAIIEQYPQWMNFTLRKRGAELWTTRHGARYRAAGVGAAIAGNRADGALIDDPVRSREDADSEVKREKVWNWFISDLRTRLKPDAWIIVIMCVTGDTPVRMADGTTREMRDVRAGDLVATYDRGRLVTARVKQWANQGPDDVLEIVTASNARVKANRRHPFLVKRGRAIEWVRLSQLRPGDQLVRARWGNGESGVASPALSRGVSFLRNVAAGATNITARIVGRMGIDRPQRMLRAGAMPGSNIAMGWMTRAMRSFLRSNAALVRYAASLHPQRTLAPIGEAIFVSTTTTQPMLCVGFSAMIATLWSGIRETSRNLWNWVQPTSDFMSDEILSITPAGHEDVFDVQIEGTENFLADGLVTHNTRWHEDDLGGRLLDRQKGLWKVLSLPAQAWGPDPETGIVPVDALGREPGQWLWGDDSYGFGNALQIIKTEYEQAGAMRDWASLFDCRPTAGDGAVFKVSFMDTVDDAPGDVVDEVRAWDIAATKKMGTSNPDWTVGVRLARLKNGTYLVRDVVRFRGGPEDVERFILSTAKADGKKVKIRLPQDPGAAGKIVLKSLGKMLAGFRVLSDTISGDKATRAGPAAAQVNIGNVACVRASWLSPFREELASFPSGMHDDQVDAFADAFSVVALQRPLVISAEALRDMKYGLRRPL